MMAFDVFISYSSKDKTTADATCASLENAGIRCWIARAIFGQAPNTARRWSMRWTIAALSF
jgi:TIR domain